MIKQIRSAADIKLIRETGHLECKLAAGKDGKGQIPEDFWRTYSAFANADGGVILLGVAEEKNHRFRVHGIESPVKLRTDLFNLLNNTQKISINLLSECDVAEFLIDGKTIISVLVRRASRKERPVYIGVNPMSGTYRRSYDGDRLCDAGYVKRLIAEQVEDSRDRRIIDGFDGSELDKESIVAFRQDLKNTRPTHIALEHDGTDFLRIIGAWRKDRETKQEGVTIAGLLMFGKIHDIWDIYPNYLLDYQEHGRNTDVETRWIDRVTLDGTWSGNLFDFYRRVYRKVIADIKVPFLIHSGRRKDETEIHVALREALVNAIIHADYSASASVLVVKRPDTFTFRNPGQMRVPPDIARQGGDGDARNRLLQHMFFLIGASDRAGTGVPNIYRGWKERGWLPPSFKQIDHPSDQTRLDLRMTDLLPRSVLEKLRETFGSRFDKLSAHQRLVLATASSEMLVTNSRMQEVCDIHRVDITKMLGGLVKNGFLVQAGRTSGTFYHLPGAFDLDFDLDAAIFELDAGDSQPRLVFRATDSESARHGSESDRLTQKSDRLDVGSDELEAGSSEPVTSTTGQNPIGSKRPVFLSTENMSSALLVELELIASKSRMSGAMDLTEMRDIVCALCKEQFLSVRCVARVMNRDERHVRNRLVVPLLAEGRLERLYPHRPSDPRQAYASKIS